MIPVLRRPAVSWPLAAAASLWLRSFFPTHVIAAAIMDDALFVRLWFEGGYAMGWGPHSPSHKRK